MNSAANMPKKIAKKLALTAGAAPVLLEVAEAEPVPDGGASEALVKVCDIRAGFGLPPYGTDCVDSTFRVLDAS